MLISEVNAGGKEPLWISLVKKGLAQGRKFYYAVGTVGSITDIKKSIGGDCWYMYMQFGDKPNMVHVWKEEEHNFTLKAFKDGFRVYPIQTEHLRESSGQPLWVSIVQMMLDKKHPVYFASGGNRIIDIDYRQTYVLLKLEHTKRKVNGKLHRQVYTIPRKDYDEWTLEKHGDGHTLTMVQNVQKPVNEQTDATDEPLIISLLRKLLSAGQTVYFVSRGGKKGARVESTHAGIAPGDVKTWWVDGVYTATSGRQQHRSVAWIDATTAYSLTLKKEGDVWVLRKKNTLKEEEHDVPMIVRLINQRIAKKGAVLVSLPTSPDHHGLKGWVTEPIVTMHGTDGLTGKPKIHYKLKTADHPSGAKGRAMYLPPDADEHYTLTTDVDGNGNKIMKMITKQNDTA